jgi:uncharacterized membrane protein
MLNHDDSTAATESILSGTADRIKSMAEEGVRRTGEYARESPMKALGYAVIAGYLLRILPLRALLAVLLDLALALMRPLAFLFGVAKVCDFATRNFNKCFTGRTSPEKNET